LLINLLAIKLLTDCNIKSIFTVYRNEVWINSIFGIKTKIGYYNMLKNK